MITNLPELTEVLDEIEFFERERTNRQLVELAILLYNFAVRFREVAPSRNTLTTRRFLSELAELYGRAPP